MGKILRSHVFSGILLYLAFLVATIPASMMDVISNRLSSGKIRFSDAEGSFWKGSATLGVLGREGERFSWKIFPGEMLRGKVHASVMEGGRRMDVIASPDMLQLKDVSLTLPASILALTGKGIESIDPGGEFQIEARDFVVSKSMKGSITGKWMNASSSVSSINPLGSYVFSGKGKDRSIELSLDTLNGPLILKGTGSWSEKEGLRFSAMGESKSEGVSDLLRVLGTPVGDGLYSLKPVKF